MNKLILIGLSLGLVSQEINGYMNFGFARSSFCQKEGYEAHPESCSKFVRCVNFGPDEGPMELVRFDFDCAPGTIYDPELEICNHPEDVRNRADGCEPKYPEVMAEEPSNSIDENPRPQVVQDPYKYQQRQFLTKTTPLQYQQIRQMPQQVQQQMYQPLYQQQQMYQPNTYQQQLQQQMYQFQQPQFQVQMPTTKQQIAVKKPQVLTTANQFAVQPQVLPVTNQQFSVQPQVLPTTNQQFSVQPQVIPTTNQQFQYQLQPQFQVQMPQMPLTHTAMTQPQFQVVQQPFQFQQQPQQQIVYQ